MTDEHSNLINEDGSINPEADRRLRDAYEAWLRAKMDPYVPKRNLTKDESQELKYCIKKTNKCYMDLHYAMERLDVDTSEEVAARILRARDLVGAAGTFLRKATLELDAGFVREQFDL